MDEGLGIYLKVKFEISGSKEVVKSFLASRKPFVCGWERRSAKVSIMLTYTSKLTCVCVGTYKLLSHKSFFFNLQVWHEITGSTSSAFITQKTQFIQAYHVQCPSRTCHWKRRAIGPRRGNTQLQSIALFLLYPSTLSHLLFRKVFAGNLAYTTTDDGLKAFFAPVQSDMYVALCTASLKLSYHLSPALPPRLFYVALVQRVMVSLLLLQQTPLKRPSKFLTSKSSTVVRWSLRLPNRPTKKTGRRRRRDQRGDPAGVAAKPFLVKSQRQKLTATYQKLKMLKHLSLVTPSNLKRKRSLLYVLGVFPI